MLHCNREMWGTQQKSSASRALWLTGAGSSTEAIVSAQSHARWMRGWASCWWTHKVTTPAGNSNLFDERLRKKGSIFWWFFMWYDWRKWFFIWSGDFGPKYGEEISLENHNHIDAILFQSSGSKVVIQIGEPCINPNALMIRVWWQWRLENKDCEHFWNHLRSKIVKTCTILSFLKRL